MKFRTRLLLFSLVVVAGCGKGPAPEAKTTPVRFVGDTIRFRVPASSPLRDALEIRLEEWGARTGGKAELVEEGEADLVLLDGQQRFSAGPLPPIPKEILKNPAIGFDSFAPRYKQVFGAREKVPVAVPLASDGVFLWYRTDLFKDPEILESFQKKHRRELAPPASWPEYLQVAEFFYGHPRVKYGTVEAMDDSPVAARLLLVHAAALAKGPRWSSFTLDAETVSPLLSNPPFVRALEQRIRARSFSPANESPNQVAISDEIARRIFREGNAAMLLSSVPPTVGMASSEQSSFAKSIDVAAIPGSNELFNPRSDRFDESMPINHCHHLATTGLYVAFARQPSPAATHLFAFLLDREGSSYLVQASRKGVLPAWPSLLAEPEAFRGYGLTASTTRKLFQLISQGLKAENWVADLRTTGAPEMEHSLAKQLVRALEGKSTPKEALGAAAKEWELLIGRNREAILTQYRASLGLPALIQ
ncbi:MAG: ABC transporter substrate-binding protein [Planctomycetota bacterium]